MTDSKEIRKNIADAKGFTYMIKSNVSSGETTNDNVNEETEEIVTYEGPHPPLLRGVPPCLRDGPLPSMVKTAHPEAFPEGKDDGNRYPTMTKMDNAYFCGEEYDCTFVAYGWLNKGIQQSITVQDLVTLSKEFLSWFETKIDKPRQNPHPECVQVWGLDNKGLMEHIQKSFNSIELIKPLFIEQIKLIVYPNTILELQFEISHPNLQRMAPLMTYLIDEHKKDPSKSTSELLKHCTRSLISSSSNKPTLEERKARRDKNKKRRK